MATAILGATNPGRNRLPATFGLYSLQSCEISYFDKAVDWRYSSIHRWIKLELYTENWAALPNLIEQNGERSLGFTLFNPA